MPVSSNQGKFLFFAAVLAVSWLSLAPGDAAPQVGAWDKPAHFLAYLGLSLLAGESFAVPRSRLLAWSGVMVLGMGLEIAQAYVPGRFAELVDGLVNVAGTMIGAVGWSIVARMWRTRRR